MEMDTQVGLLVYSSILLSLVDYSYAKPRYYSTCPSYCDANGLWHSESYCSGKYCCGNLTYRYCCRNYSLDISDDYDSVDSCSCAQNECYDTESDAVWTSVVYFVAPLIFFLAVAVCCCQCVFQKPCNRDCMRGRASGNSNRIASTSTSDPSSPEETSGDTSTSVHHNPEFVLQPPDYETVTKDLPKYDELFNDNTGHEVISMGTVNQGHEAMASEFHEQPNENLQRDEVLDPPPGEPTQTNTPPGESNVNQESLPPSYSIATAMNETA